MQVKGQWDLEATNIGGHLRPLGWWNKDIRGSTIVVIDKRLKKTRMHHHPEENVRLCMRQRIRTRVTGTVTWKIYDNSLRNWSWRLGVSAKGDPPRGLPMTATRKEVMLGGHHTGVPLGYLGIGQLRPET